MNFAHGVQIPNEFNFGIFPDDFGYLWAPEVDIEGVHGSGVNSIQNVSESQIQRYLLITLFKSPLSPLPSRIHQIPAGQSLTTVKSTITQPSMRAPR